MKVAIVIPSALSSVPKDTFYSILYAYSYLVGKMDDLPFKIEHLEILAPETFPIDANRNVAVGQILEKGFDTSIWLDADQTFPINTFVRLLNSPYPITTGIYHVKMQPYYPVIFQETFGKNFTWFRPIINYPKDDYFKADMMGMGCVRIDRKVFEKIAESYEEKAEWFKYGVNPVTIEMAEKIQNEGEKNIAMIKEKYLVRDVSEDVYFCKQIKELTDYFIAVDPKIQCGHVGKLIIDKSLSDSFKDNLLFQLKEKDEQEYKRIVENLCEAEPIKNES